MVGVPLMTAGSRKHPDVYGHNHQEENHNGNLLVLLDKGILQSHEAANQSRSPNIKPVLPLPTRPHGG